MTTTTEHSGAPPPRLSIIIVNWNGGELLCRCVDSIARYPPSASYEIVIVDNASTDGSVRAVKDAARTGRNVTVIENSENVGFSRANNQAIAHSTGPLLFLLNPDAEVTSGAIDALIRTLESDMRTGACGPRLLNSDGSLQHSAWRNPPPAWQILVCGTGLWRVIPPPLRGYLLLGGHWNHSKLRAVPMLFGAAILVKRRVIELVGAFDERFHMYAEDNELCLRMTRAGWRIVFEPAATVVHHGGQFSSRRWTDEERVRVKMRAYLDFQRYSMPPIRVLANLVAGSVAAGIQCIWRTLTGNRAGDARIVLELHAADLKRALWNAADERASHR